MHNLNGKVAIVTGSSRGIGMAIAQELSQLGASVVLCSRNLNDCIKAERSMKRKCMSIKCDVSKKSDIDSLVKQTIKSFGRIHILVNNAGIYNAKLLIETDEHDWDSVIDINLKSVFLFSKAVAEHMIKNRIKGSIVNIASIAGEVGIGDSAAYCASKAGVINLTRELSLELSRYNIRVNAIGPGAIKTAMTSFIHNNPKVEKEILLQIPLGRMGQPSEIAKAAAFLVSDDASYITGQTLFVDGGWLSK